MAARMALTMLKSALKTGTSTRLCIPTNRFCSQRSMFPVLGRLYQSNSQASRSAITFARSISNSGHTPTTFNHNRIASRNAQSLTQLANKQVRLSKPSNLIFVNSIRSYSKIPNTPTKEQLLARANNFFERLKVRFKWLVKRSNRPFNTDDYSAFFLWLVMGNVLLVILGTTSFFSLLIFTANTVFAQEFVARKLGEVITKNSNLTVVFEHAIVPGWRDGKISFRKCFVSRRPSNGKQFVQGSPEEAYATSQATTYEKDEIDDGNYTQFDLTIEEVNVTLSFNKWLNGNGMIETLEVKGIRGVVDRTHVVWDPDDDATNYKNISQPGDFEFLDFKMEDVLFTLMQPAGFRHFDVAIYNCELPKLRKHWLFYDLINSNIMSGSYDGSLFTIHKKQRLDDYNEKNKNNGPSEFHRVTRWRIDSLSVDHLNTGMEGPFGWITDGDVDMVGDFMVPEENKDVNVTELVGIIAELIKREATRYRNAGVPNPHKISKTTKDTELNNETASVSTEDVKDYLVLDLMLRLNNVRASVPFQTRELLYVNYALIRPIVAYINLKNTYIEIHNRVVKNVMDFSGSWTVYDCLLMDDIQAVVYDNFVDYVADEESRMLRVRKLGFWTLQVFLQVLVIGLGLLA